MIMVSMEYGSNFLLVFSVSTLLMYLRFDYLTQLT
jgi:hypothetical protein